MEREEIEDLIHSILDERVQHPGQRAKMTRFTTPEGKTWVSTTLERGEMVRKMLVIMAVLIGSTVALVQFSNRWFLIPTIDDRAKAQIQAHEIRVKAEMQAITPTFVTRAEFDRRVASSDVKWENQQEFNGRVEAALVVIQADVKELLKRVR